MLHLGFRNGWKEGFSAYRRNEALWTYFPLPPLGGSWLLGQSLKVIASKRTVLLWEELNRRTTIQPRPNFLIVLVQLLSDVRLFATSWIAAGQVPCPSSSPGVCSNSCPVNQWCYPTILCCPLLLLPSIFPSIRVFSNELALHIKWPKYWTFSFSISPSNEYSGLISFRTDWFDLFAAQGSSILWRVFSSATIKADVMHVGWASYSAKGFVYSNLSSSQ